MITSLLLEQNCTKRAFNHTVTSILHDDASFGSVLRHCMEEKSHISCVDAAVVNPISSGNVFWTVLR
jgi:hypothetical protein